MAEFRQHLRAIELNLALEPGIRPRLPDIYRKLRNTEFARPAAESEARINHQRTANHQQTIRLCKQGEGASDAFRRHRVAVENDIRFHDTAAADTLGNPKFADTSTTRQRDIGITIRSGDRSRFRKLRIVVFNPSLQQRTRSPLTATQTNDVGQRTVELDEFPLTCLLVEPVDILR